MHTKQGSWPELCLENYIFKKQVKAELSSKAESGCFTDGQYMNAQELWELGQGLWWIDLPPATFNQNPAAKSSTHNELVTRAEP
jgi:hypothetical protein